MAHQHTHTHTHTCARTHARTHSLAQAHSSLFLCSLTISAASHTTFHFSIANQARTQHTHPHSLSPLLSRTLDRHCHLTPVEFSQSNIPRKFNQISLLFSLSLSLSLSPFSSLVPFLSHLWTRKPKRDFFPSVFLPLEISSPANLKHQSSDQKRKIIIWLASTAADRSLLINHLFRGPRPETWQPPTSTSTSTTTPLPTPQSTRTVKGSQFKVLQFVS